MARLADGVARRLAEPLAVMGFRKRAGALFTLELAAEMLGWIGLNSATEHYPPGVVAINPVIGVRSQAVERVVAELSGAKPHAYLPPTVSVPLAYLRPEARYRTWVFGADGDAAAADELLRDVKAYALPYVRSINDMTEMAKRLEAGETYREGRMYRRPVAWLLAGETNRALASLSQALSELGDQDNPFATRYRSFAAAFRDRAGSHG